MDRVTLNRDRSGRIDLKWWQCCETFMQCNVIPFGDDIGRATSFNIVEHGIDYTSAPTFAFPHYAVLKTVSGTILTMKHLQLI